MGIIVVVGERDRQMIVSPAERPRRIIGGDHLVDGEHGFAATGHRDFDLRTLARRMQLRGTLCDFDGGPRRRKVELPDWSRYRIPQRLGSLSGRPSQLQYDFTVI